MSKYLNKLLKEKQERDDFRSKVLDAVSKEYYCVDWRTQSARQSACSGNFFTYMAKELDVINSTQFKLRVREVLGDDIKHCSSLGYRWIKGLVAKDQTKDSKIKEVSIKQAYKDHRAYKARIRKSRG